MITPAPKACDKERIGKKETRVDEKLIGKIVPNMDECMPCDCGHNHGTLVMGQQAGSANGGEFSLAHAFGPCAVVITCNKSQREFRIGWSELVELAIERGIRGGAFKNQKEG